ncbi:MAG: YjjI family glycine radical enzyme [Paludibacteraceae bacterium]|nr:YjjI family glycine radical enzyme [Paludibacteraceae bacterium]
MANIYDIVTSRKLSYEQKVNALAHAAEDTLDVLKISEKTHFYLDKGIICNLNEGNAPYRPRYIMPDYDKAIRNGVKFLELEPPTDFDELLTFLQILYRHVPSITTYPVFLGNLDKIIEPYITDLPDEIVEKKLRNFFIYLDRTITDSFCHANLGPEDTRAGRLILKVDQQLKQAVPNLTLKYDPDITPDDYAEQAIVTSLHVANPAICNHKLNATTYDNYGISSCYNILPIGGGSYTLTRIVLPRLAQLTDNKDEFLNTLLPDALHCMADYMSERIRFIVEKSGFFESNFLATEGFVERDRFVAMFGLVGLAEAANHFMPEGKKYGNDAEADDLAEQILKTISDFAAQYECPYCEIANHRLLLHAQVGIDTDYGITSGIRIPVGDEPQSIYDHLRHSARFHKYIPTGCSDILPFDITGKKNPAAVLDIVKGAFQLGQKYIAFYADDSDLVRITGYLVKRSEMEKWNNGKVVLQNTTQFGAPAYSSGHLADRKVRHV